MHSPAILFGSLLEEREGSTPDPASFFLCFLFSRKSLEQKKANTWNYVESRCWSLHSAVVTRPLAKQAGTRSLWASEFFLTKACVRYTPDPNNVILWYVCVFSSLVFFALVVLLPS